MRTRCSIVFRLTRLAGICFKRECARRSALSLSWHRAMAPTVQFSEITNHGCGPLKAETRVRIPLGRCLLVPDGHAANGEGEIEAHYRANPVGDPNPCFQYA